MELHITLKVKNFLSQTFRGVFPIRDNLRRKGVELEGGCCNYMEDEATFHLFFQCSFARDCWRILYMDLSCMRTFLTLS